jgi:hypothetical protein
MLLLFVYWEWCPYMGRGNDVVIWVLGMLFFCFCICNDDVICVFVMMLFVYWEYCCYLGIGNAGVICIFGMMLLFLYR